MKIYKLESLHHFQQYIILKAQKRLDNWMIRPSGQYSRFLLSLAMDHLKISLFMFPLWDKTYTINLIKKYEDLKLAPSVLLSETPYKNLKTVQLFQIGDLTKFISPPLCLTCRVYFKREILEYQKQNSLSLKVIVNLGETFN